MNAEDTANHIFVDGNAESQGDLLGDAGTTPVAIAPFQFNDCLDEFFLRSFRARRTPGLARKQPHRDDLRTTQELARGAELRTNIL